MDPWFLLVSLYYSWSTAFRMDIKFYLYHINKGESFITSKLQINQLIIWAWFFQSSEFLKQFEQMSTYWHKIKLRINYFIFINLLSFINIQVFPELNFPQRLQSSSLRHNMADGDTCISKGHNALKFTSLRTFLVLHLRVFKRQFLGLHFSILHS